MANRGNGEKGAPHLMSMMVSLNFSASAIAMPIALLPKLQTEGW
jgi:hypothetical protein